MNRYCKLILILGAVVLGLYPASAQGLNPLEVARVIREITPVTLAVYQVRYLPLLDARPQTRFTPDQAKALLPHFNRLASQDELSLEQYRRIGTAISQVLTAEQDTYYSRLVKEQGKDNPALKDSEMKLLLEYYQAKIAYNPFAPNGFAHSDLKNLIKLLEARAREKA